MIDVTNRETKDAVFDASKILIATCILTGSERLDFEVNGFHHATRGELGDWIITCKRSTWWSRLLFRLRN